MIKLGDHTFEVPVPRAMATFALQQRIVPVVGGLIGAWSKLDGAADGMEAIAAIAPAVGEAFTKLPPGELEALTRELLADAKVHGFPVKNAQAALFGGPGGDLFDTVFQGRTVDIWQLLWHAIQIWYPDFFSLARAQNGSAAKAKDSEASSI